MSSHKAITLRDLGSLHVGDLFFEVEATSLPRMKCFLDVGSEPRTVRAECVACGATVASATIADIGTLGHAFSAHIENHLSVSVSLVSAPENGAANEQ